MEIECCGGGIIENSEFNDLQLWSEKIMREIGSQTCDISKPN